MYGISEFDKGFLVRVGYCDRKPIFEKIFYFKGDRERALKEAKKWAKEKTCLICKSGYNSGIYSRKTKLSTTGYPGITVSRIHKRNRKSPYYTLKVYYRPRLGQPKCKSFGFSNFKDPFDAYKAAVEFKKEQDLKRYGCFSEECDEKTMRRKFNRMIKLLHERYGDEFLNYINKFRR